MVWGCPYYVCGKLVGFLLDVVRGMFVVCYLWYVCGMFVAYYVRRIKLTSVLT